MAINLPTLIQRVRVDTSGLGKAEKQAKGFAAAMRAASKDIDAETRRLQQDTDKVTESTKKSNAAHKDTPKAVDPATRALRENSKATREVTRETETMSRTTRRTRRDNDVLGNSIRNLGRDARKAKEDLRSVNSILGRVGSAVGGLGAKLFKLDALAGLVGPVATGLSSLGAGAIAVVGGLGQMTAALGAASIAAVGSLSKMSGVVAGFPIALGALATGFLAVKASFKGIGTYEKAVAKYGKDSDQAKKAFKAMSPEVRTLSKEVRVYTSAFKDMSDISAQYAAPSIGAALAKAEPILGIFKKSARDLAVEVGSLAESFGGLFGSKGFRNDVGTLTARNTKVFAALGQGLKPLVTAFVNIMVAAGPMTSMLAKASAQFAKFLDVKTSNRKGLAAFFTNAGEQAVYFLKAIGDVTGGLIGIGSIGSKVFFGKDGMGKGVGDVAAKFNDWTNGPGGIRAITGWFERMKPIAEKTWRSFVNVAVGLFHLGSIGSQVFFGRDGMVGGIDKASAKFRAWADSPGGVKAVTGYFAEMKPIAAEAWAIVKDVATGLFNLGRDKNTAGLLKQIRTELLPNIVILANKAADLGPILVKGLKGLTDFIANRDLTLMIALADSLANMASAAGSLMKSSPVFATMTSFLLTAMVARKLLGAKLLTGLLPLGLGGAAKGAAVVGATAPAATGLAGAGEVAATGLAGAGATGAVAKAWRLVKGGAVKGLRAGIFAMIAYAVGNAVVDSAIKPTAEKGTKGGNDALAAKAVWEASGKTVEDAKVYSDALTTAAAGIKASSGGVAGALIYGVNSITTGMGNWFSGKNNDDLKTAQRKAIDAIEAEAAQVKIETDAKKALFDATPAGKAAAAKAAAAKAAAAAKEANKPKTKTAKEAQTREDFRVAADRKRISDWKNNRGDYALPASGPERLRRLTLGKDAPKPAEVLSAEQRERDRADVAALAKKAADIALAEKNVRDLQITADSKALAARQSIADIGGGRSGRDPVAQAAAAAAARKLADAKAARDKLTGAVKDGDAARKAADIEALRGIQRGTAAVVAAKEKLAARANEKAANLTAEVGDTGRVAGSVASRAATAANDAVTAAKARDAAARAALTGALNAPGDTAKPPDVPGPKWDAAALAVEARKAARATYKAFQAELVTGLNSITPQAARLATAIGQALAAGIMPGAMSAQNVIARISEQIAALEAAGVPITHQLRVSIDRQASGRGVPLADGGLLTGNRGGPREDNLLFRGSRGEFVVNARATAQHRALIEAINSGRFAGGGLLGAANTTSAITSPYQPRPAAASAPAPAAGPRPMMFNIGTVEDGDTLLRRARANDRMLSLAEGGDSNQMAGIGA